MICYHPEELLPINIRWKVLSVIQELHLEGWGCRAQSFVLLSAWLPTRTTKLTKAITGHITCCSGSQQGIEEFGIWYHDITTLTNLYLSQVVPIWQDGELICSIPSLSSTGNVPGTCVYAQQNLMLYWNRLLSPVLSSSFHKVYSSWLIKSYRATSLCSFLTYYR